VVESQSNKAERTEILIEQAQSRLLRRISRTDEFQKQILVYALSLAVGTTTLIGPACMCSEAEFRFQVSFTSRAFSQSMPRFQPGLQEPSLYSHCNFARSYHSNTTYFE
jgi:hypothetical protein